MTNAEQVPERKHAAKAEINSMDFILLSSIVGCLSFAVAGIRCNKHQIGVSSVSLQKLVWPAAALKPFVTCVSPFADPLAA